MNDKIALVTGAGSGIGRAVSLGLLEEGYKVCLTGRNPVHLEETKSLSPYFTNAYVLPSDVTKPDRIDKLFLSIGDRFERLDLLFNNAGINITGPLEKLDFHDWNAVVETNLTGAFLCTQWAFKMMKNQNPQGGRIINNGSISAYVPRPESVAYTCSKHAITGLTRSTSLEGRAYNIACGQIDIGNVETSMVQRMKAGALQADGNIRVEPTFELKHVVDAVVYMASLPLNANVQFMTVMATNMPYIGRG